MNHFGMGWKLGIKRPENEEDLCCAQEMSQQSSFIERELDKSRDGFPPLDKA